MHSTGHTNKRTASQVHINTAEKPKTERNRKLRCLISSLSIFALRKLWNTYVQFLLPADPPHIPLVLHCAPSNDLALRLTILCAYYICH